MHAIELRDLVKRFDRIEAVRGVTLAIPRGQICGYLGPNGAGKTTTIRLLLGLIKPNSGHVSVFGLDTQSKIIDVHKRIAYVPGEATLWPQLTGMETLHLLGKVHGRVDRAYRDELIERFKFEPDKKVRAYSKGNRQKISIIAALVTRAELLVMDEPTVGLDPLMEQVFRQCVIEAKENGQTVLLSSHILSDVEALCDRIAILRKGKLVELGTLEEMRHLLSMTVEASFNAAPPTIDNINGVTSVNVTGHQLTCQVQGDIAPLLSALAAAGPKTFISREPSLEELFLSLYGDDGNQSREICDEC